MASKWIEVAGLGQSIWYDNVARPALTSGLLRRIIDEDAVTGGTSNPSIFAAAVEKSDLYDAEIGTASAGDSVDDIFERAAVADIQAACDLFAPVHERTGGRDGYVSLEVEADLAYESARTVDRALRLRSLVARPNVMIKVPGTAQGVEAFRQLTRAGVSVNVTLLFGVPRYLEIAQAYVEGIEARVAAGEDVSAIDSVASFFISRIDSKVDALLPDRSPLRGRIAIANAKVGYADVYETIFSGPRWERLRESGANAQRALWASTSTKNPVYPATMYADGLIGPDTVNTVPDATLEAFRTAGTPTMSLTADVDVARSQLADLAAAGVDLDEITTALEAEGVTAFAKAYDGMLAAIGAKHSTR